jgi:hypothetical protein
VGARTDAAGTARPTAWTSRDGLAWRALAVTPRYPYGPTQTLTAAACTGDRLVAVGGVAGGAHGNLRISTWLSTGDGPLVEQPAGFESYGGPEQIDTSHAVAGPHGFLLVGDRAPADRGPGAAVWYSPTGTGFTLVDRDPALAWGPERSTAASGATALPGGDWLVVGYLAPAAHPASRVPAAWRSTDGRGWREVVPPAATPGGTPATGGTATPGGTPATGGTDAAFERAAVAGGRLVVVGVSGDGFAAWTAPAAEPGALAPAGRITGFGGTRLPGTLALVPVGTASGSLVVAAVDDGSGDRLWAGNPTGARLDWRPVRQPRALPGGPGHEVTVTALGRRLLLATGTGDRLWLADLA